MLAIIRVIDALTAVIGKTASWLTLMMIVVTSGLVIARYGFNKYSIPVQESVQYMHAAVFLLGAAWALQADGHVRVDIFYRGFSPRKKALANIFGTLLFLFPFFIMMLYFSWGYMLQSWQGHENSSQAGGLPYVYVLKTLMPLFAGLMLLQGAAELLRNILILCGKIAPPVQEA